MCVWAHVILHTSNGGNLWQIQSLANFQPLEDILFINNQVGWAVGGLPSEQGLILKTNDGGATWSQQDCGLDSMIFYCVTFINSMIGWAAGDDGRIAYTSDGGVFWDEQSSGLNTAITDICFVNENYGWIVSDTNILFTTSGGTQWEIQYGWDNYLLTSICFVNEFDGFVVGNRGLILATEDGGQVWEEQSKRIDQLHTINSIYFVDHYNGWVISTNGYKNRIISTNDAGNTWDLLYEVSGFELKDIVFVDQLEGWVSGGAAQPFEGVILHSNDGGASWETQYSGTANRGLSICFTDNNNGWVVGSASTILHTSDGGDTWESQQVPGNYFYDIYFINSDTGWVVGQYGNILYGSIYKTTDGGNTWNHKTSGTDKTLYKVHFVDYYNGWIIGSEGTILHSNTAGSSWGHQVSGLNVYSESLQDIHFLNEEVGWIVGCVGLMCDSSIMLYTLDGGYHWELHTGIITKRLNELFFLDQNEGWCLGNSGQIYHTYDGTFVGSIEKEEISIDNIKIDIFPNPLHNQTKIEIENFSPGEPVEFYLFDFLGREVFRTVIDSSPYILKRQGLPDGMYLWKAVGSEGMAAGKLVLE